jgi:hypothetical protein
MQSAARKVGSGHYVVALSGASERATIAARFAVFSLMSMIVMSHNNVDLPQHAGIQ